MVLPLIVGNWKMYKTPSQARAFVREMLPLIHETGVQIAVCPPAICLPAVAEVLEESRRKILLGGQNIHEASEGAYTGEISAPMLRDVGAAFVLCGHSERRQYFSESNAQVAAKAKAAWDNEMFPIVCIGETQKERQTGATFAILEKQLTGSLAAWCGQKKLAVAYEPIWAIGTGLTATPQDAQEAMAFIRRQLAVAFGAPAASAVSLLYGGSVKPNNIASLMACPDVDGVLVGGASLDAKSFATICHFNIRAADFDVRADK